MKTVIHQPLRHVLGGGLVKSAQVQNAFVGHQAVAAIKRWEILFQPGRNIVGVQNRKFGRLRQSFGARHGDIHPGNRQNSGASPRRGRNRANVQF